LTLILALTLPVSNFASAHSFPEYQVKALFVVNFGFYTRWPEKDKNHEGLEFCVIGYYPFSNYFSKENIDKFPIKTSIHVRKLKLTDSTDGCQMLFISQNEEANVPSIIKQVADKPILTIGESNNFIESGGIILLTIDNEVVTFEINLEAQRKAGIVLSSRFLSLAKKVYGQNNSSKDSGKLF